jgi:hypothetical protein
MRAVSESKNVAAASLSLTDDQIARLTAAAGPATEQLWAPGAPAAGIRFPLTDPLE